MVGLQWCFCVLISTLSLNSLGASLLATEVCPLPPSPHPSSILLLPSEPSACLPLPTSSPTAGSVQVEDVPQTQMILRDYQVVPIPLIVLVIILIAAFMGFGVAFCRRGRGVMLNIMAPQRRREHKDLDVEIKEKQTSSLSRLEQDPDEGIKEKLQSAGLDPSYWLVIVKDELNVSIPEELESIREEFYQDLAQHIRKACEKIALRKLLGMREDEQSSLISGREKKQEELKKYEKAEAKLQQLRELEKHGSDRHESAVKEVEDGVREVLKIPPDAWLQEDKPLDELTTSLQIYLDKLIGDLKVREDLNAVTVLNNASGGCSLRGILLSNEREDRLKVREKLLRAPEHINFVGPSLPVEEKITIFANKQKEESFCMAVERLGYHAAVSDYFGSSMEGSPLLSPDIGDEIITEHHQEQYSSTVNCLFVPVASFLFEDTQLQLSQDALTHLKAIEILVFEAPKNCFELQEKCEAFFEKYGSHANKGALHFGGIYWWKCYSQGFQRSEIKQVRHLQSQIVTTSVRRSYGPWGIGSSVEGDWSKLIAEVTSNFSKTLNSQTHLCMTQTGGPPEVTDLHQWETGLVASNSTWSVIDCGANEVPVWKIIQMNHRTEFKEPGKLVQVLLKAWQRMTKEEDVKSTLREVSSWNEIRDPSKCEECLNDLLRTKLNLCKSKKIQAWPYIYLSEVPIQQYLKWVVEVMQGKNTKHIKALMQRLVEPSDLNVVKNFPGKHLIFKWLNQTNLPANSKLPKCTDLKSLQHCVSKALKQLHEATAGDNIENVEQVQKQVTSYVAELINELHTCICIQQKYDRFFLSTLLYPLSYDINEGFFGHLLSTDDLEYFSKVLGDQIIEFKQLKSECMMQAYLFHLAVSFLHSRVDIEFQSMCCDHLHYLQMEIHDQLDQKIKDILSRHSISTSYDWAGLQQDLLEFICLSADDAQTTVGSQLLNFLTIVQSATKHEIPQPYKSQYQRAKGNKEIQNVFEILGVSDFYPQKLTRKHALCVRQQKPESKQFYILEKIMMHNYEYWTCLIENDTFVLHPVDSLLALLLCADNFVRQDLLVKISTCKLAIPLLLPDPIAQTVTLPLWGMRPIVKEWKCKDTGTGKTTFTLMECSMVEHETPIVSFMRFSDSDPDSGKSKSKILNEVIGNSQHNFFFHWDCEGGNAKRVLVDGVVELCWYLPAGKEADSFNKPIAFTNLRGDARKHRLQFEFLRQISLINFVLLTQNDLDDESIKVLEQLAQAPGVLVLMFPDAKDGDELTALESMSSTGYETIRMKRKNLAVIKREIRSHITVNLQVQSEVDSGSPQFKSLKHCSEIAEQVGILIDEDDLECIAGLRLARKVLQKIQEVKDSDSVAGVKEKMLPLQSQAMWHTWAQHNKERHRHLNKGLMTTTAYNIEMDNKKDEIHRVQFLLCDPPTPVMKSFMSSLIQQKGYVRDYFLHWLKFFLDKRSRQILPPLQSQYDKLKCELQKTSPDETTGNEFKAEKENVKEHMKKMKKNREELANINEKMIIASLGIEHLFRELGQMYESVMDVPVGDEEQRKRKVLKKLHSKVSCLPVIAAELLIAGYPFELMDGDASHVPMTWMMAVLDELHTLLKRNGNAKLFAVSVLGIQSSGKSTLMNTMFGAKFAVSAGRCTRGAFIQLIPIQKDTETCDYLLVVDTEGLRALELDSQKMLKRDNEMATFVIGLANVTIINIFGETPSDMQDILQTSVHAFLRMNKLELKPSCQFVHQNVTAVAADSKLMQGRANLVENLNEMVKYVAKEEQCESKYTFDQVVSFDLENDVWYFPSLWKGDPPMAPVNPGYSEKAQDLKSALTTIATRAKSKFSVIAFKKHIKALWDAVLYESFVFSFKNMLEMAAYNELDCKRGQWSSELQSSIMKLQTKLDNKVYSSDVTELDNLQIELITHLEETVQELQEDLLKQAEAFFTNCGEHVDIMIQWKEQTRNNLIHLCDKHRNQTDDYCRSLIQNRRDRVLLDKLRGNIYQNIQEPVRKLALDLRGEKLGKKELEKKFSDLWGKLRARELRSRKIDVKVESSVEGSLKALFLLKNAKELSQKLSECGLRERGKQLELSVIPKLHLTKGFWKVVREWFGETCQGPADTQTKVFLENAEKHLKDICSKKKEYSDVLSTQVLRNVYEAVDGYNQDDGKDFMFTEEYKMDLCLTVAGHSVGQFEKMVRENAPSTIFESLREPWYIKFESQYFQRSTEEAAAKGLSFHLKGRIQTAVVDSLVPEVVRLVKLHDERFHSKQGLLYNILLDLVKKGSFSHFFLHLTNVEKSLQTWIQEYTLEYCRTVTESGQSRLEQLAGEELKAKVTLIQTAVTDATRSIEMEAKEELSAKVATIKGAAVDAAQSLEQLAIANLNAKVALIKDAAMDATKKLAEEENGDSELSAKFANINHLAMDAIGQPPNGELSTKLGLIKDTTVDATRFLEQLPNAELNDKVAIMKGAAMDATQSLEQFTDLSEKVVPIKDAAVDASNSLDQLTNAELSDRIARIKDAAVDATQSVEQLGSTELSAKFALVKVTAMNALRSPLKTLRCWLTKFHEPLKSSFHLNLEEICQVLGVVESGNDEDEKADFEFFKTELIKRLQNVEEEIHGTLKMLPTEMKDWKCRPYDVLAGEMIGCCEQCPFCKTKCEYLDSEHLHVGKNHHVSIHRPECLSGNKWDNSGEMVLDICTTSVEGSDRFRNDDTGGECVDYKNYREIYKNWTIVPNSSPYDSSFWKYFVAHYTDDLAEHFGMEKPAPASDGDKLLEEWKKLDKEKVLETLKLSFNLSS